MKLLLVYPGNPDLGDHNRGKSRRFPAVGLPVIASLSPADWDITLVDEEQGETIDFSGGYDLVGISSMTSQAPRAYEIGDEFLRRSVPVVHGGSHPSVCRDEALHHGSAVVAGEGEMAWPELVRDFIATGQVPHKVYERRPGLEEPWYVAPRRELVVKKNTFPITPMVATRGCPFTCSFCSVFSVFGRGYRHRPVDEVVEEVRALRDAGHKNMVFLDDNIMGNAGWSKELFRKLAPLKVHWAGQAHLGTARDPELLDLAQKSGLFALFIGIESISRSALLSVRKGINDTEKYHEWLKIMHGHGILVIAGIIFGFDKDDLSVFARTVEVLDRLDIGVANFSPLMPLPGTDVHRKLTAEGRIIDTNWAHYDGSHVVFRPAKMTPEQLDEGSDWAAHQYFKPLRIVRRFGSNWRHPLFYWTMSLAYLYKERTQHGAGSALKMGRAERRELLTTFGLA
jgi:radical SAM superfamily enzyme YgiQ (UPF0313 family)